MAMRHKKLDQNMSGLRLYNRVAGILHLVQAVGLGTLLALVENQFLYSVNRAFPLSAGAAGAENGAIELFSINFGLGLVFALALSASFHFLISSRFFFDRYSRGLRLNRNNFRWTEYSINASVLLFLAAQMSGISNVVSLVAIFGLSTSMVLFCALQEKYEQPGSGGFLPFIFASLFGFISWVIIGTGFVATENSTSAAGSFASQAAALLFAFFLAFGINQFFQSKRIGRWKDYLRGERVFIFLSLLSKTGLVYLLIDVLLLPQLI